LYQKNKKKKNFFFLGDINSSIDILLKEFG